jgi:hypothetical protein
MIKAAVFCVCLVNLNIQAFVEKTENLPKCEEKLDDLLPMKVRRF